MEIELEQRLGELIELGVDTSKVHCVTDILDMLPSYIVIELFDVVFDNGKEDVYCHIDIGKDEDNIYELSYVNGIWDKELFCVNGTLISCAIDALKWCKDNNKLTVMNHENNQESKS